MVAFRLPYVKSGYKAHVAMSIPIAPFGEFDITFAIIDATAFNDNLGSCHVFMLYIFHN